MSNFYIFFVFIQSFKIHTLWLFFPPGVFREDKIVELADIWRSVKSIKKHPVFVDCDRSRVPWHNVKHIPGSYNWNNFRSIWKVFWKQRFQPSCQIGSSYVLKADIIMCSIACWSPEEVFWRFWPFYVKFNMVVKSSCHHPECWVKIFDRNAWITTSWSQNTFIFVFTRFNLKSLCFRCSHSESSHGQLIVWSLWP